MANKIGDGAETLASGDGETAQDPVYLLSDAIEHIFWDKLVRRIDQHSIEQTAVDPKDWTVDRSPRIYVSRGDPEQYQCYSLLAAKRPKLNLEVLWVPKGTLSIPFLRTICERPGLLALATERCRNESDQEELHGLPFTVPGGRFNEMYGWDSYMMALGLLRHNRIDLARGIVQNFCYEIQHYGMVLNANRSYYLGRSQPPFLTDLAFRVYERIKDEPGALEFLRTAICTAIKEYYTVWMAEPRLDPITGLSRYRPHGVGIPPETESNHFLQILGPYMTKHCKDYTQFLAAYNRGDIVEPELDDYFLHDRGVRESGHDTSYRLESVCADLATTDLNFLLFKYESDIAQAISRYFDGKLGVPADFCVDSRSPGYIEYSDTWLGRQQARKTAIDTYLWSEKDGMFFDYDTAKQKITDFDSATTFWALWAGAASQDQAEKLLSNALPRLECVGGLASTSERSRGPIAPSRPMRQWDYPFGWAPHQMLMWTGLRRYGFEGVAQRLAYKWLFLITTTYSRFGGLVAEKYDVTNCEEPHKVDAEYGNQSSSHEGFGWTNASYVVGLDFLDQDKRRALGALVPWDELESK